MRLNKFKRFLEVIFVAIIRCYQIYISPLFAPCCRFYPSCSEYTIIAIIQYGPFKGSILGLKRLLKCHPLHPGGYDPVK